MENAALQKIGQTVAQLRKEAGFSQEGFATYAKIERARFGRIERGELNISMKALFRLAFYLEVRPEVLLSGITVSDYALEDATPS